MGDGAIYLVSRYKMSFINSETLVKFNATTLQLRSSMFDQEERIATVAKNIYLLSH